MSKKPANKKKGKARPKRNIESLYESMSAKRSLARGGKLRMGEPKEKDRPGRNLDHFRFTADPGLDVALQDRIEAEFQAMFGSAPKIVSGIILIGKDVREVLQMKYRAYFGNQVVSVRCDGNFIERKWSDDAQDWLNYTRGAQACAWDDPDKQDACPHKCELRGVLSFMIPALCEVVGYEFFIAIESQSMANVGQWGGKIRTIEASPEHSFADTFCRLERYQQVMDVPVKGKPAKVNQWMARLETQDMILLAALSAAEGQARLAAGAVSLGQEAVVTADAPPEIVPYALATTLSGPDHRMAHWWDDVEQRIEYETWCSKYFMLEPGEIADALEYYADNGGDTANFSRLTANGLALVWHHMSDQETDWGDIPVKIKRHNLPVGERAEEIRAEAQLLWEMFSSDN